MGNTLSKYNLLNYDSEADIDRIEASKIIILAAGTYTRALLRNKSYLSVAYICDNDQAKHGEAINGVPIYGFDKLKEETDSNVCLLIASADYMNDFLQQILDMKLLERNRDWIVCGYRPPGHITFIKNIRPIKDKSSYFFEDRRNHSDKMLVMLAGYKPMLWDLVLKRLKRFIPLDVDVCIATNGKYDETIRSICKDNNWSYLSTNRVDIATTLNSAIMLFEDAEYILKMDEDIFICEGFYEGLVETYRKVEAESNYHIGLVAPVIPVNPHGYIRYLEITGKTEDFSRKFGKPFYGYKDHLMAKHEPTIYLWENTFPLDATAKRFRDMPFSYFICPHRFSLGASLFKREALEKIGYIQGSGGIGSEEEDIMVKFLSKINYYTIIIAENVLAGHLAFSFSEDYLIQGRIIDPIEKFYKENQNMFDISL